MNNTKLTILLIIWNISLCCLFMFKGLLSYINLTIFIGIPIYIMKKEDNL